MAYPQKQQKKPKGFAIGGYHQDGNYLQRAEVFEFGAKAWRPIGQLRKAQAALGIAAVEKVVLVAGGLPGNSMERYDAEQDQWRSAAVPIHRFSFGLATLRDNIYAVGGYFLNSGSFSAMTYVEKYTPLLDKWSPCPISANKTSESQFRIDCT